MVYDEVTEELKPRWGYKRANDATMKDIPIIEHKAGDDPSADPWSELRKEKKTKSG